MLGPALSEMLHRLANIRPNDRTDDQKQVLEELSRLYAAFPDPEKTSPANPGIHAELRAALATMSDLSNFSALTLTTKPKASAPKCPNCGFSPVP